MPRPEDAAREEIDAALVSAGWAVQDYAQLNLDAAWGVAIREFPLGKGSGAADYLLYVDGQAVGVVEAKKASSCLRIPPMNRRARCLRGSTLGNKLPR